MLINQQYQIFLSKVHNKVKNYYCDLCPYSSFFKHSIEEHVFKHVKGTNFSCDLCDFTTNAAFRIALHKKYNHESNENNQSIKSILCELCGKKFPRPAQLDQHIRLTHEKRKDKVCGICDKRFSSGEFAFEISSSW
jgi:KRAB domain-containing zinc finger protein